MSSWHPLSPDEDAQDSRSTSYFAPHSSHQNAAVPSLFGALEQSEASSIDDLDENAQAGVLPLTPRPHHHLNPEATAWTLSLPRPPSELSNAELKACLAAELARLPSEAEQPPSPAVLSLLVALLLRYESTQKDVRRAEALRDAQTTALCDLIRDHAPAVSSNLVDRTLVRARSSPVPSVDDVEQGKSTRWTFQVGSSRDLEPPILPVSSSEVEEMDAVRFFEDCG